MELTNDHYKKGDPFPPRANTDVLRIYSYRPCPFAERANLVLTAKGIPYERIDVQLRADLPDWVRDRNPSGQVPIIEFGPDNKVLYESLIVTDYLDEAFPGRKLRADEPFQRASDRLFVDKICPLLLVFGKLMSKEDKSVVWKEIQESLKKAEELLKKNRKGHFVSGKDLPGLVDYAIWPMVERIPIALQLFLDDNPNNYIDEELPTIADYRRLMLSDPTVKKVSVEYEKLFNFSKVFLDSFNK